ncbi:transcription initiation factor TFIID subunit 8-like [Syzygium oleosum]|uniref:transcription initiation factor TFIID subunit 8-like n=1 Tax=Syzygium oleosum TaxID=219896 RepID=UPI0011D295BB|nr:transcription initiation factor TFIID subunit 8-like [Syzygium oleosum]
MSDGGRENRREHEISSGHRKSGVDNFARAIAKIAVAQVCETEGFQAFQQSALETFSDVAVRYIHDVGKTVLLYANLAGRTEISVFDVIQGLEDLSLGFGFVGASDIDHCLVQSGVVRELLQYVGDSDELPFAYALPQLPIIRDRKQTPSFLQAGVEPPHEHIPSWLPPFPDTQDHVQLPMQENGAKDPQLVDVEHGKGDQKPDQQSSLSVQLLHSINGLEGPPPVDERNAAKLKEAAVTNPYLAAPLNFGEKEVSPAVLPAKLSSQAAVGDHVGQKQVIYGKISALEAFVPGIESMKGGLNDSDEGQKKVFPSQRPPVQFKIRTGKRSFNANPNSSFENEGLIWGSPRHGKSYSDDDKKKSSEKVAEDSVESAHDPA